MTLSLVRPLKRTSIVWIVGIFIAIFSAALIGTGASAATYDATWIDSNTIRVGNDSENTFTGPVDGTKFTREVGICTSTITFASAADMDKPNPSATFSNMVMGENSCESVGGTTHTVEFTNSRGDVEEGGGGTGGGTGEEESEVVTCNWSGIGWIVCPAARAISEVTDAAYAAVEQLMVFRPVEDPFDTSSENTLYTVWSNVRSLANVAFILAFFAIIFSQATSVGISSYGIKRMVPRLVIAAIMVNLSYWICILAVDFSNILGAGVGGIIKAALGGSPDTAIPLGAANILTGALAYTGVLIGAGTAIVITHGAVIVTLATLLLVPLILAVLVALVVLVGRQAFLIILIALAPLAFVAYILPGTEDWFNRWRKIFITLLIFYPLMGILFYGSQVAAEIMRDTSSNPLVKVFSLGVQGIPLVATPFMLQWAGGTLGRIAGMVNNPNKGPLDRLRKWGDSTAEGMKKRGQTKRLNRYTEGLNSEKDGNNKGKKSRRRRAADMYAAYTVGQQAKKAATEENLREAQVSAQAARIGADESFASTLAGGDPSKIGVVQARAKAAEAKMEGERVAAAGSLVSETGVFRPGSTYSIKNEEGKKIQTFGKDDALMRAIAGQTVTITDASGKDHELSTKGNPYMTSAILDTIGKEGNVKLMHSLDRVAEGDGVGANMTTEDRASLRGQIADAKSSNTASMIAKAPDWYKTPAGAFDNPTAADVASWHGSTANRFEEYIKTLSPADAANVRTNIERAYREIESTPELKSRTSQDTLATVSNVIRSGGPSGGSPGPSGGGGGPTPSAPSGGGSGPSGGSSPSSGGAATTPQKDYTVVYDNSVLSSPTQVDMIIQSAGGANNLSNKDIDNITASLRGKQGGETIIQQVTEVKEARKASDKATKLNNPKANSSAPETDSATGRTYPGGIDRDKWDSFHNW